MLNNSTSPLVEPGFILAVKITAGTTCILSFFGSCLIIFSYVALRDLRTAARQLLVNLSIADIIISLSHFVGLFANFERFIDLNSPYLTTNISTTDPVCISQAAFTLYGSVSSFLWSMAIAFYLVLLSVFSAYRKEVCLKKILIPILYIVCWGVPIMLIIPNVIEHHFGFTLAVDVGESHMLIYYSIACLFRRENIFAKHQISFLLHIIFFDDQVLDLVHVETPNLQKLILRVF